jgi:colanic acid/amylovoran biosynthesis protein
MSEAAKHVVLVGASITGNRGAESMLMAAVQHIGEQLPGVRFTLLSLYPTEDRKENELPGLQLVPFRPTQIVLQFFPAAVAAALARRFHMPWPNALMPLAARTVKEADLVVDLSGISFVDGRSYGTLLYNVIVAVAPTLLGSRSFKYAQALGPFSTMINRLAARVCLPKVERIAARGRITEEHLVSLGVERRRIMRCADAAFAMRVNADAERRARDLQRHAAFERPVVAIAPSSVVDARFTERAQDYAALMSRFIDWLAGDRGFGVLLLAHSTRPWTTSEKDNDLPLCRRIHARLRHTGACCFVQDAHHADTLRALLGRCRFLVTSRFHAMISGLSVEVPSLLIGWSHKYLEVLESFGLEAFAIDFADVDFERLTQRFRDLEQRELDVRGKIRARLPEILESSLDNARIAVELLRTPI